MRAAFDQARKVSLGDAWSAFLLGSPGNGKTHLAIAAVFEHGGIFWKVPDFLAWLRNKLATSIRDYGSGMGAEEIIQTYSHVDRSLGAPALVVFDDLGAENQTEWASEQLYRILDSRYEEELPTIITSNMPFESIDPRIRSRYRSGLVVCDGKDLRS